MRLARFCFTASYLITASIQTAIAAPITMICSDYGKNYIVKFDPSSKKLIVNADEGIFYSHMVARRYHVSKISSDAGGYKIVASGGLAGPHIVVYTGAEKKVDYLDTSFGWVFATDPCRLSLPLVR